MAGSEPEGAAPTWSWQSTKVQSTGSPALSPASKPALPSPCVSQSVSSVVQSCPTLCSPWAVARQALLSMGFSRQEYWSVLPCPPPRVLPHPWTGPTSPTAPALQADSLLLRHQGSPLITLTSLSSVQSLSRVRFLAAL